MESYLAVNQISLDSVHHCTPPPKLKLSTAPTKAFWWRRSVEDNCSLFKILALTDCSLSKFDVAFRLMLQSGILGLVCSCQVRGPAVPPATDLPSATSAGFNSLSTYLMATTLSYVCLRTSSLYLSSRRVLGKMSSFPLSYSTNECVSILESQPLSEEVGVVTTSTS